MEVHSAPELLVIWRTLGPWWQCLECCHCVLCSGTKRTGKTAQLDFNRITSYEVGNAALATATRGLSSCSLGSPGLLGPGSKDPLALTPVMGVLAPSSNAWQRGKGVPRARRRSPNCRVTTDSEAAVYSKAPPRKENLPSLNMLSTAHPELSQSLTPLDRSLPDARPRKTHFTIVPPPGKSKNFPVDGRIFGNAQRAPPKNRTLRATQCYMCCAHHRRTAL